MTHEILLRNTMAVQSCTCELMQFRIDTIIQSCIHQIVDEFNKKVSYTQEDMDAHRLGNLTRTEFDWLSRDTIEVAKYIEHPFCGHECSIGFWDDFIRSLVRLHQPEAHAGIPKNLPKYIMLGSEDPCHESLKAVRQICAEQQAAGLSAPKVLIYGDARHEILNEINREEVTSDLLKILCEIVGHPRL